MDQHGLSTEELLRLLFKSPSLPVFLEEKEEDLSLSAFHEHITALCSERGEVPEHIIRRAGLERSYGHQLFSGRRTPSRDTALQLAFGFALSVAETQQLLRIAGKSPLYPRVKRDAAILYCLFHGIPFDDAQIVLHDLDLPVLGREPKP